MFSTASFSSTDFSLSLAPTTLTCLLARKAKLEMGKPSYFVSTNKRRCQFFATKTVLEKKVL